MSSNVLQNFILLRQVDLMNLQTHYGVTEGQTIHSNAGKTWDHVKMFLLLAQRTFST